RVGAVAGVQRQAREVPAVVDDRVPGTGALRRQHADGTGQALARNRVGGAPAQERPVAIALVVNIERRGAVDGNTAVNVVQVVRGGADVDDVVAVVQADGHGYVGRDRFHVYRVKAGGLDSDGSNRTGLEREGLAVDREKHASCGRLVDNEMVDRKQRRL